MAPTHDLAVYGWDESAERLVHALRATGGIRLAAVGDRHASSLVRARAATGSACYQHALEMFRTARYDCALLATAEDVAPAAEAASAHGAALLMHGEDTPGAAMLDVAEAALRARVPLAVLRPRLRQAGLAFLADLAAAEDGWRPRFLDLTVTGPGAPVAMLRDAAALANRLTQAGPAAVVAFTADGPETAEASAIAADLRYADRLVSLRTRVGAVAQVRLVAECPLGDLELRSDDGTATVTMRFRDGRCETARLEDRDLHAEEARRARAILDGAADDALIAPRDGATLAALEASLATGEVVRVQERLSRANLVVLAGGAHATRRRARLHVVGA